MKYVDNNKRKNLPPKLIIIIQVTLILLVAMSSLAKSASVDSDAVTVDALRDPVQHKSMRRVWATGYILGRPTRGTPNDGLIFKTDEMHIIIGNFQDDTKYSGNTIDVSTKSRSIFNQVEGLDSKKQYVFHFHEVYPFHFNMQSTYIMVDGVEPAPHPAQFAKSNLPRAIEITNGKIGGRSGPAVTSGRIVIVTRRDSYFLNRPFCTFVLDQGGTLRGSEEFTVANEKPFQVYSETACRYLESILPFGLDVKVTYTRAYVTIDRFANFASRIEIAKIPQAERDEL